MRLIDAEANIETMKKCAENPESEQALLCYRYTQRILEEAPTVPAAPRWHRVEERLPERYVQCLVRDNDNNYAVGYYRQDAKAWDSPFFGWLERDDEYYKDGDLRRIGKVVAWMPIEPPKEVQL